jgi:hypothetical protein
MFRSFCLSEKGNVPSASFAGEEKISCSRRELNTAELANSKSFYRPLVVLYGYIIGKSSEHDIAFFPT